MRKITATVFSDFQKPSEPDTKFRITLPDGGHLECGVGRFAWAVDYVSTRFGSKAGAFARAAIKNAIVRWNCNAFLLRLPSEVLDYAAFEIAAAEQQTRAAELDLTISSLPEIHTQHEAA